MSADDLKAIKEALGEKPFPNGFRSIENEFLPDDLIVVSKRVYEELKKKYQPENSLNQ